MDKSAKLVIDYFHSELGLEERLAASAAASKGRVPAAGAIVEERYSSVAEYDPVPRSHCRLETETA